MTFSQMPRKRHFPSPSLAFRLEFGFASGQALQPSLQFPLPPRLTHLYSFRLHHLPKIRVIEIIKHRFFDLLTPLHPTGQIMIFATNPEKLKLSRCRWDHAMGHPFQPENFPENRSIHKD